MKKAIALEPTTGWSYIADDKHVDGIIYDQGLEGAKSVETKRAFVDFLGNLPHPWLFAWLSMSVGSLKEAGFCHIHLIAHSMGAEVLCNRFRGTGQG